MAAGVVVFLLVVSQILVPSLGERMIENRLTEGGGSADVSLGAFPAARLLFSDGERFEVDARGLDLSLDPNQQVLDKLDGFSIVDVSIADSKAGPISLQSFELDRDGDGPYHLTAAGETSPSQLVDSGIEGLNLPGGSLAGAALDLLGGDTADTSVPIDLDVEMTSDAGRVQVVSGDASVGGIPTGPLVELLTSAIVLQL